MFMYSRVPVMVLSFFFFFNDTATTEIYTLSLHDALPICRAARVEPRRPRLPRAHQGRARRHRAVRGRRHREPLGGLPLRDRKSTRLNSSHPSISYAVFCLKKKKNKTHHHS